MVAAIGTATRAIDDADAPTLSQNVLASSAAGVPTDSSAPEVIKPPPQASPPNSTIADSIRRFMRWLPAFDRRLPTRAFPPCPSAVRHILESNEENGPLEKVPLRDRKTINGGIRSTGE